MGPQARSNSRTSCPAAEVFRIESPMMSETCKVGSLILCQGGLVIKPSLEALSKGHVVSSIRIAGTGI